MTKIYHLQVFKLCMETDEGGISMDKFPDGESKDTKKKDDRPAILKFAEKMKVKLTSEDRQLGGKPLLKVRTLDEMSACLNPSPDDKF